MRPWTKGPWRVLLLALLTVLPSIAAAARMEVLVIHSQSRLLPANVEIDAGLVRPGDLLPKADVQFFLEYLDHPTFNGEVFAEQTAKYLAEKYAPQPPKLIVVVGYIALQFVLKYRSELFPAVPILHLGVDKSILASMPRFLLT